MVCRLSLCRSARIAGPRPPVPAALGNLMFGQCCQEASGRPAFLVGLSGKGSPDQFYGGQPQLGEK
jgi:hypothetical protein